MKNQIIFLSKKVLDFLVVLKNKEALSPVHQTHDLQLHHPHLSLQLPKNNEAN